MKKYNLKKNKMYDSPIDRLDCVNSMIRFLGDAICQEEPDAFTIDKEAGRGLYFIFDIIHDSIKDVITDLEKEGNIK